MPKAQVKNKIPKPPSFSKDTSPTPGTNKIQFVDIVKTQSKSAINIQDHETENEGGSNTADNSYLKHNFIKIKKVKAKIPRLKLELLRIIDRPKAVNYNKADQS